jgi:protein involved in polysaccharide export with SLBB domain
VDVDIIRASYDKVRVRGAVNNPGVVKIGAGDSISLNDLLLRAGGMKATARGAKVKVVRKGMTTAVAPSLEGREYTMVTEEGHPEVPDVELHNNDDVYVFSSRAEPSVDVGEKRITVLGQVKRQGIYRFSGGEPCTMMHLVFKMGGLPRYADATEIKLIREEEDGFETEMEVNVKEILKEGDPDKDIPLENGDRVVVPARRIHLF